jgi:5-methylthioadenosine/S-adenosylhomocysteine deaminase
MSSPQTDAAGTLLLAGYVVTDPRLRTASLIPDGAIFMRGGEIVDVGEAARLTAQYPEAVVVDARECIAIPGFIDAHNHGQGMTTFCLGTEDDMLEAWGHYWPGRSPRPAEQMYWDTLVAAARQIRSGVTTSMRHDTPSLSFASYQSEAEAILNAYATSGLRAAYALGITDQFRLVYDENEKFIATLTPTLKEAALRLLEPGERIEPAQYFEYITGLVTQYQHSERVRILLGTIGPQWDSDQMLIALRDKAQELGTGLHGPLQETLYQKLYAERTFGHSGGEHFYRLGLLSPNYSCAHGVWLTDSDMDRFAETGATVVHCPSSNLRLYSGTAPIPVMLERGVNVALGVDSESINDNDDTFQEMRLAMMLHRQPGRPGRTIDEWDALTMATVNGARAVLQEGRLGALLPGYAADITCVRLAGLAEPHLMAGISPVAALVYHGTPADVQTVMVHGEIVYRDGRHTRFDAVEARRRLQEIMEQIDRPEERAADALRAQLIPSIKAYYEDWDLSSLDPYYILNSKS